MPRASAHGTSSATTAATATVLRPTVCALLVTRCCGSTMFCAGFFHFLCVLAVFFVTAFSIFFGLAKSIFDFFEFVPIKPLNFVLACGLLVHVRISHRFHQFLAHGNHLLA